MAASRLEIMQNTDKLYIDGECSSKYVPDHRQP